MVTKLKPILHQFRIRCPWKGCDGVINIARDIEDNCTLLFKGKDSTCGSHEHAKMKRGSEPQEVGWMIHTFVCPKCHNAVGNLDIMPDGWATWLPNGKEGALGIHIKMPKPRKLKSGRIIKWGMKDITHSIDCDTKHQAMNKYLKPWARWPKRKKKKEGATR